MDNTKIFIDIDDEITFVAQRINDAPTKNIILVVPEKASIIGSLASLKLLKYVTEKSQKNIILVTMDDMGKIIATKAGFLVRNRVGEVENTIWQAFEKPVAKGVNPLEESPVIETPAPEETPQIVNEKVEEPLMLPPEDELVVVPVEPVVNEVHEEVKEEPVMAPKNKYVESIKIIKLDNFELVVGGDIAAIRRSREIERKVISQKKQTINSLYATNDEEGIIGKDVEADVAKKKVTT